MEIFSSRVSDLSRKCFLSLKHTIDCNRGKASSEGSTFKYNSTFLKHTERKIVAMSIVNGLHLEEKKTAKKRRIAI